MSDDSSERASCEANMFIPLPGDLVLWRFGRAFAHGAIVAAWPRIIHAELQARRVLAEDAERSARLVTIGERVADQGKPRPRKFFRLRRWSSEAKAASDISERPSCEAICDERARLVAEAESWIGTPYHTGARVKGAGVDCLTFVAGVFENAGLVPKLAIPHYPPDWHLHRDDERYLEGVLQYCVEVGIGESR